MANKIVIAVLVCLVGCSFAKFRENGIFPKQLAGPPSEFGNHNLPVPSDAAQNQKSTFIPMWITSEDEALNTLPQSVLWQSTIYIDSDAQFQLSFSSPLASVSTLVFTDANGNVVDLGEGYAGEFPIGQAQAPETTYMIATPTVGVYTLTVESSDPKVTRTSVISDDVPAGYVITLNLSPLLLVSHLNSYNMQQGQQIGVVATIVEQSDFSRVTDLKKANVRKDVITTAVMAITLPDGSEEEVTMHDDGLHFDYEANDGIYGANIQASELGTYSAQAVLTGQNSAGVLFTRTSQHLIVAVPDDLSLTGTAVGQMTDNEHLTIALDITTNDEESTSFSGYAEVWAVDDNGNEVAVCWIGGMTEITEQNTVELVLDVKWMKLAGAKPPITLKNIMMQDSQNWVPVTSFSSIKVAMNAATHASILSLDVAVTAPTKEMKQGVFPEALKPKNLTAGDGAVILVHGYCSSENPWSAYPADWTNAYYFLTPSSSLTHDAFSKAVLNYATANGITKYSIVGHSQGGIVGAHILNYYFSGMDIHESGRKVQSLGTPFEGCTIAGSAADLGDAFGVGCGANFDLSLDGSKLWEPSLSTDTRSDVYYYTTTYKQGNLFGDWCNLAVNMLLEWPNDGTSELVYTDLKGANNLGNTQKQCHTSGMAYVAQYYDHTRNKEMNSKAAR